MSHSLRKKTSGLIATIMISFIIISFMFTGYQGMVNPPNTVASVDKNPIKVDEYRMSYNNTLNMYKQYFNQGKALSAKQIEQFGIKKQALKSLISKKIMANLATDLGIKASKKELRKFIERELPRKTGGQLNMEQYRVFIKRQKTVAEQYGLTPQNFQEDFKIQKIQELFQKSSISEKFVQDIIKFKKNRFTMSGAKIEKDSMKKFIVVAKTDIIKFIQDKTNSGKIQTLFQSKKRNLDRPMQVKARHILLKTNGKNEEKILSKIKEIRKQLTSKNFAKLAKKYTEDPSGKTNGGELGWFGKNRMDPAFEKAAFKLAKGEISQPVKGQFGLHLIYLTDRKKGHIAKIQDHQNDIAKEILQGQKKDKLKKLIRDLSKKITHYFELNDIKKIDKLEKKYNFQVVKEQSIDQLGSTNSNSMGLKHAQILNLFKEFKEDNNKPLVKTIDSTKEVIIVRIENHKKKKGETVIKIEEEMKQQKSRFVSKFRTDALERLEKAATIKTYAQML